MTIEEISVRCFEELKLCNNTFLASRANAIHRSSTGMILFSRVLTATMLDELSPLKTQHHTVQTLINCTVHALTLVEPEGRKKVWTFKSRVDDVKIKM